MSPSLEADDRKFESDLIPLADAAVELGCHVETLRLRVRSGELAATRGPHGRYYVRKADLERLARPRRMRSRRLDDAVLAGVHRRIHELLAGPRRLMGWHRDLLMQVAEDASAELPLYHVIAVRSLVADGYNTAEIAEILGISVRHVYRLASADVLAALSRAWLRHRRAESGRLRREARAMVSDIQRRLAAAGFRTARRAFRRRDSEGNVLRVYLAPERLAVVHSLTADQRRGLLRAGLEERQVEAIELIGIGADELHELLVNGLPG